MATTNINRFVRATGIALLIGIATPAAGQRTAPALQPAPQPREVREEPAPRPSNVPGTITTRPRTAPQTLLPAPDEPQGETPQQLAATQQDREWLIAYLISHEGYNIHQIDQLEARLEKMSPTLIGSLVILYKQKHERALQREAAVQAMRQNMVAADEMQLRRNQTALNRVNTDENSAAQYEQTRLDTQQQQTMQGYYENAPYRSAPYGGRYAYPYQYFPAYGY